MRWLFDVLEHLDILLSKVFSESDPKWIRLACSEVQSVVSSDFQDLAWKLSEFDASEDCTSHYPVIPLLWLRKLNKLSLLVSITWYLTDSALLFIVQQFSAPEESLKLQAASNLRLWAWKSISCDKVHMMEGIGLIQVLEKADVVSWL